MRKRSWLIRGGVLAVVHVVTRALLGFSVQTAPSFRFLESTIAVALVVVCALLWAGIDGVAESRGDNAVDQKAAPNTDLTMMWLQAGVLTGVASGIVSWILNQLVDFGVTTLNLVGELSAGLAATALLVFVPALLGCALGRAIGRRRAVVTGKRVVSSPTWDSDTEELIAVSASDPSGTFANTDQKDRRIGSALPRRRHWRRDRTL